MSKGFASNHRIVVLASLVLFSFAGLGSRLVCLHVIDRTQLLGYIQKARREIIPEYARRGDILDIGSTLLATSHSLVVLGVDPQSERPEDAKKWPQLARLTGLPLAQLETILTTKFRPAPPASTPGGAPASLVLNLKINLPTSVAPATLPAAQPPVAGPDADDDTVLDPTDAQGRRQIHWAKLSDQITEPTYAEIMKLGIAGVYGNRVYRRIYPHNELAAHLIGYVNGQQTPVSSIERYADFYLRGQDGWVESEKDGRQRELAEFRTREVPAANGDSVMLSIDSEVQRIVEDELAVIAEKYQPQKASIIVSDPRTGFILAMANYPSFNLNEYNKLTKEQQRRMRNSAVADLYEPGSVMKIVSIAGALEDGLVSPESTFDCNLAKIEYRGKLRDLPPEDNGEHHDHPLTVREITAHSSNKGAVQLAMRMGEKRWFEYAHAFGFGLPTGFPVGSEPEARVFRLYLPPPEKWDDVRFTRMPMGHAVSVTALQTHVAMSVIASGGVLLRPQIIKQIRDASGGIAYRFDQVVEHRVVSERTAHKVAELLEGVVQKGATGERAEIPGYEVAGKTGTTQKIDPETGHYQNNHHVSSFIGFFPASNPQLEISVIVDDADARTPGGIGFGGMVSAPAFKDIALKLIANRDIRRPFPAGDRPVLALEGGRR